MRLYDKALKMHEKNQAIASAYLNLRTSFEVLQGKWIDATHLVQLISARYNIPENVKLDTRVLNMALSQQLNIVEFDVHNPAGHYRKAKRILMDDGKVQWLNLYYYLQTASLESPVPPIEREEWLDMLQQLKLTTEQLCDNNFNGQPILESDTTNDIFAELGVGRTAQARRDAEPMAAVDGAAALVAVDDAAPTAVDGERSNPDTKGEEGPVTLVQSTSPKRTGQSPLTAVSCLGIPNHRLQVEGLSSTGLVDLVR